MKKVVLFLAEGFEEVEALTPVDVLRRANIEVTTVSICQSKQVEGAHAITVSADFLFDEISYSNFDALLLPGGMPGTSNLMTHDGLKKVILDFNAHKKLIGAICAAPMILGELGLLAGKKAVCYPGFEKHLKEAIYTKQPVVKDGRYITASGIGSAMKFSLVLVEELIDKDTANRLGQKMLVQ
ncbi:DJ-1/PfpI family protein [Carboxylicivirga sediminis]|uniref:DJ-1/PfpI family protein n=1 Tax=Carboxylicivirga sediminis TaxID=2006564 RepID=A0A941F789_9BACT|nr:DJ-1 family glyoxalase III [Carboxylicivirga sediminis]MBR8536950.1 DJ-1/PfpI family protein [Carboxylicivirga sediminis]